MAGRPPGSAISIAPSKVCSALVIVASPSVSASGVALSLPDMAMSSAATKGGRRAPRKAARAAIEGTDTVMSPSPLGLSPSAIAPSKANFASGESSANSNRLEAPFAAASGSLNTPAIAIRAFRHSADRLKRS